jgi:menaquinone-dependent protoporphyrinogen oxidase
MPDTVLVTYATRYGSTQEVADAVASALREAGLAVDLQPVKQVRSLEGYGAVVLGAPIYIGSFLKDAQRFLAAHGGALGGRPLAVFAVGPIGGTPGDEGWQGARQQLDQQLQKIPGLAPVAVELFGGKYDPAKLHFTDRLLAILPASPLHNLPANDSRDWTAIRAWAGDLAAKLRPALSK